jgi:hypothetical protein
MTDDTSEAFPPPQKVILRHQEVMGAAIASNSRIRGASIWLGLTLFLLLCAAIWLGHIFTFWFVQQLPFAVMFALGTYLSFVIPAVFALVAVKIALDIENRRASRAYLRALAAIGAPLEREGVYEVTDEALVLTTERVVVAPRWVAIDTVEKGDAGWVISADQLHFLIPFADFASVDAQRPLLAAITSRMTPEARARSRDAVEFAEVAPERPQDFARTDSPWVASAPEDVATPLPGTPVATGWLTQEQAGWAASVIYRKTAKTSFHGWAYPFVSAVSGMVTGSLIIGVIAFVLPPETVWRFPLLAMSMGLTVPLLGGAIGLAIGNRRLAVVLDLAWRHGLAARGVPEQIEAQWALTNTGLAYRTARFEGEAVYASIHQVLHEHGYWIAGCDTLTLCIPDTAFASPDEADAFASALLSRIPEAAKARSVVIEPTAS